MPRNEVKKDADKCIENLFLLFTFTFYDEEKALCVWLGQLLPANSTFALQLKIEGDAKGVEDGDETKNVFLIVVHQLAKLTIN